MLMFNFKTLAEVQYKNEDIVAIKFPTYRELEKAGEFDLQEYKKHEVFILIYFRNGRTSTFPTSSWNIELI